MKILLTGSTGLIGRNIIVSCPEEIEIVTLNRDGSTLGGSFDAIIHAAGYAQPSKFTHDEIETIRINTSMTMELFKLLKPGGKFLFMSTSEIYSGAIPPYKETDIGTTNPTHPRACYIESKRCGEAICLAYQRQGFDVKIARLSLVYGATKRGDGRALNSFVEQGLSGEIILMDQGEAKRTYLYVEDAVKMLWDILLKGQQTIYNVGGESKTTILELAQTIGKIMNVPVHTADDVVFSNGVGAPADVSLDMTTFNNEFGRRELTSLEEGLRRTIKETK